MSEVIDRMVNDIRNLNPHKGFSGLVKKEKILHDVREADTRPSVADMTANVDRDELNDETMKAAIDLKCTEAASRLRQRATMLRDRAEELDIIADKTENRIRNDLLACIDLTVEHLKGCDRVLAAINHINPEGINAKNV